MSKLVKVEEIFNAEDNTLIQQNVSLLEEYKESFKQKESFIEKLEKEIQDEITTSNVEVLPANSDERLFSKVTCKHDFIRIKKNLVSLINKGQQLIDNIISSYDGIDIKPQMVQSIATLSSAITDQLRLLMEIHKNILDMDDQLSGGIVMGGKGKGNTTINNQSIFIGDTANLLKHLKRNI